MIDIDRYHQLCTLAHQRKLEQAEIDELKDLSQQLDKPNPIALTQASVYTKIAILNSQNQILILWRSADSPMPGRADLPGGGLDFGEHPAEGAKREAQEEVGLILNQVELITIGNFVHNNQFQLMFGFQGYSQDQSIRLSWEHDHFAWMSLDNALTIAELPDRHKQLLLTLKLNLLQKQ